VALECGFFRQVLTRTGVSYRLVEEDDILGTPLRVLIETIGPTRAELRKSTKSGAGRQRLHERLLGDPRVALARSSAWLLRECRVGEEGPVQPNRLVYELMQKIWVYATGDQPTEDFLQYAAEEGAKAVRGGLPNPRVSATMRGLIRSSQQQTND
jgi:hypothetical protein